MSALYLARQPIYDRDLGVFAYELLYRSNEENRAPSDAGDQATYEVLGNALAEIGLEELVGPHYAFINFTRGFFAGENPMPFSGKQVVLEVLEDVPPDAAVLSGVQRFSEMGHMIALDDFVYDDTLLPLIKLADIIKIDIMALDDQQLQQHVEILRQHDVKLLAEKVETQAEFETCKALGFDYFQGYFFCKPNLLKRNRVPGSQLAIAQLLAKLSDPEVSIDALDEIVSRDVSISYKLLRYVNSALFSLPTKVESLHQAMMYLGLDLVKRLIMLLAMAGVDDKPHELLTTALVRAKLCEQISALRGHGSQERCFIVGLFSVLDALVDMPLEDVLPSLSLAEEINDALLNKQGIAGQALQSVIAFEQGQWQVFEKNAIAQEQIQPLYLQAITWAREMTAGLNENPAD